MRRKGDFSGDIARKENYYKAFDHASKNKHGKKAITKFEADLEKNLSDLLYSFENGTFVTSPYRFMTVHEPKKRLIGMLPFPDHVQHWAMLNEVEDYFTRSFSAYTYGGVRGRGPHAYMRMIRKVLRKYPERTTDYLLCDIHHFYPTVNHPVLKSQLRTRIKDNHLLRRLDEIIDSVEGDTGMFPGTKLAQFFSLVYLYLFDHDLKRCFHVGECPALVEYYADDVLILHEDTVFLHLVIEWIGLYYANELRIGLNPRWKIGHVTDGVDTGGYVHFPDHVRVRKRNKVALCRQIARLRKKGLPDEEIRKRASSRIGFIQHADTSNLLNKLGMETPRKRLGQVIRNKKSPWEDLPADRKMRFEDILYDTRIPEDRRGPEEDRLIELIDYKIEDSKIERNEDGTPKKCLAIRFRWKGEERYAFTGSAVLIDQALTDFSHEDLPVDTVIKVLTNKFGKKFFRFT